MFFQSFFFACGGAILYINGDVIRKAWAAGTQDQLHNDEYWNIIEFTGASAAILLYVSSSLHILTNIITF